MKWVKRVVGLLVALPVLALLGLLLAGQRADAGRSAASLEIARPPEEVFRYFQDGALLPVWTRMSVVPTDWLKQGRHSRFIGRVRRQSIETDCEVVALEPNRRIDLLLRSQPGSHLAFEQRADFRFQPIERGTRVTVALETRYDTALLRLLEPLVTASSGRDTQERLARLKALIEGETGVGTAK
jgi:uncharacterized protein YndB with AHSA1/START domain